MQVVIEEVDPLTCIDELLELFKRGGKPKTREFFEWYYEDKGFGAPLSWVLREKGIASAAIDIGLRPIEPGPGPHVANRMCGTRVAAT